jgi:hypothetical protein
MDSTRLSGRRLNLNKLMVYSPGWTVHLIESNRSVAEVSAEMPPTAIGERRLRTDGASLNAMAAAGQPSHSQSSRTPRGMIFALSGLPPFVAGQ